MCVVLNLEMRVLDLYNGQRKIRAESMECVIFL